MIVELGVDHLLRGLGDGAGALSVDQLERQVHLGRGALDDAKRADQRPRHALGADPEVLNGTLGLRAPVAVGCDLDRAEGVALGSAASRAARSDRSFGHHFLRKRSSRTTSAPPDLSAGWSAPGLSLAGLSLASVGSGLAGTLVRAGSFLESGLAS